MLFHKSRGLVSTGLITFFFGIFAGLLWVGRGRLAAIWALVSSAALIFALLYGLPVLPKHIRGDLLVTWGWLAYGLTGVDFVWRWRLGTVSTKWYSHGAAVTVLGIVLPISLSIGCYAWLGEPFSVHDESMQPTLVNGDNYLVLKGALFDSPPRLGSVVEFHTGDGPRTSVGRIVGQGGDTIQMISGTLHINGSAVSLVPTGDCNCPGMPPLAKLQWETLPNGVSYEVVNFIEGHPGDDTETSVVPADHYFVLGDNRDTSNDSRFALGFVHSDDIIGQAIRVFWNSRGVDYRQRRILVPDEESPVAAE
ncbi:signal peptidase I [Phyllobacterium sp. K27]